VEEKQHAWPKKKTKGKIACLQAKIRDTHTSYMPLSILDWKDMVG
jgi:hypothetical protein